MRAGRLNRRVVIQAKLNTPNELGELVGGWGSIAAVWANIMQKSGMETIRNDMQMSVVDASIRIRYRTDVTAGMRVVDGNTVYDIQAVIFDRQNKQFVDLVCQTGASNG